MSVYFHEEDLPADVLAPGPVAVDTETMGLVTPRDRLCLVQISDGRGDEHLVRFKPGSDYAAPNLRAVLADPERLKLYHFARFDLAAIRHYLGVMAAPVFCTKIASRLIRTYTDRHGLKELVREVLGKELSKVQQSSDWARPRSTMRSAIMPPATCASCTRCTWRWTRGWCARGGARSRRPVSISCPRAPNSISPAGRKLIFSRTLNISRPLKDARSACVRPPQA